MDKITELKAKAFEKVVFIENLKQNIDRTNQELMQIQQQIAEEQKLQSEQISELAKEQAKKKK